MPRLDFEKQFAEQLKDRELKPSAGSWEKLQERLEQGEKKSTARYWWMGIAASLVAGLLLFTFLGQQPVVDNSPVIVEKPEQQFEKLQEQKAGSEGLAVEESESNSETVPLYRGQPLPEAADHTPVAESNADVASAGDSEKIISEEKHQPIKEFFEVQKSEENTVAVSMEPSGESEINQAEIDDLLENAMAEVSQEMEGDIEVTDAEIDALMAEARAELRKEQGLYQTETLSADQLLTEVETELEHSFRAKVFEIIKDGLRKTRNAVADINE